MLAHNVIIIGSGKGALADTGALDRLIGEVLAIGKTPILVIGPDGDELLRHCNRIEDCELVFDPNYDGEFFSSVKAGLHATNGAAFVVPLVETPPPSSLWGRLEQELWHDDASQSCDVIRLVTQNDAPSLDQTLQVVTQRGVRNLKTLPAATDWLACDRISVRAVEIG